MRGEFWMWIWNQQTWCSIICLCSRQKIFLLPRQSWCHWRWFLGFLQKIQNRDLRRNINIINYAKIIFVFLVRITHTLYFFSTIFQFPPRSVSIQCVASHVCQLNQVSHSLSLLISILDISDPVASQLHVFCWSS